MTIRFFGKKFLGCFLALSFVFFHYLPAAQGAESSVPVVVSIAPQKYIIEKIAKGAVSVTILVKPGSDPHSYEPSPSQVRALHAAKAWFTIGVPFEDVWQPRLRSDGDGPTIISFITGIDRLEFKDTKYLLDILRGRGEQAPPENTNADSKSAHGHAGHEHGSEDPHVWLSPMLVRKMLPHIARELGKIIPEKRQEFRRNAAAFAQELEQLDQQIALRLSEFPQNQRVFLTFHPSWGYFAHNYQLTELSIEVDGKEPGAKTMKDIIDIARSYGINTIFIEPQYSKNAAKAIADSLNASVVEVDPLQENLMELYQSFAEALAKSFKR